MTIEELNRKLAAILYADVAGYSRLTGIDEEGTHRLLSDGLDLASATVEQFGGRVVHYAGDAVLADFGTVSAGLTCAVSIQRELRQKNSDLPKDRQLQFRMGFNLGEVIVDRDDIYGDGVNVAARLAALANPGGILLTEAARNAIGIKLPYSYEYMGEQSVKNIVQPVRVYRVLMDDAKPELEPIFRSAEKPSIAVLPFKNMSQDPGQEYFVDGVTEDIITALSYVRWFFVISRNSAFAYKDRPVDVRQAARELGVRYVLEGSVRKAGDRVRVTAQLVDGDSGKHVWAKRFDRDYEDIFAVQDEITGVIVGAIEPELGKAEQERARAKRPENLGAWDLYQRGLWYLYHYTKDDLKQARVLFRRAAERDPFLGAAFSGMAEACYFSLVYGHSSSPEQDRDTALAAARTAVELDPQDPAARCTLGRIQYLRGEHDLAIPELEIALELNPSLAWGHYGIGAALVFSGRAEEAIPHLREAIRLSPRDPNMGSFLVRMADAHLFQGDYESAVDWANRALRQPHFQWSRYAVLIAALGHLNREEEAAKVLQELLLHRPDFSVQFVQTTHLIADPKDMQHYLQGLRKAGVS